MLATAGMSFAWINNANFYSHAHLKSSYHVKNGCISAVRSLVLKSFAFKSMKIDACEKISHSIFSRSISWLLVVQKLCNLLYKL